MGFTSFIGMIVCVAAIVWGIFDLGGDLLYFINIPSIALTVIPTIGAIVATYPFSLVSKVPSHFKVLLGKGYQIETYINQIVSISKKARTEGLLSLENEPVDEPFLKYALRMVVDGVDEEIIRNSLEDSLAGLNNRHAEASALYEKAAAYAPAFGMCATVIGLINMLLGLDFSDPSAINSLGGNMSMALITTLYGSMMANILFLPIAGRLKTLHKREIFCKTMISNSILAIQRGENPTVIQESLLEQVNKKTKQRLAASAGGTAGGDSK